MLKMACFCSTSNCSHLTWFLDFSDRSASRKIMIQDLDTMYCTPYKNGMNLHNFEKLLELSKNIFCKE